LAHATRRAAGIGNLSFTQGDILELPDELDGQFDLLVIADTLYYLSPLSDDLLKTLSMRLARLLTPEGICVLANHFFFAADAESRVSRRIHDAFCWSQGFDLLSQHRKAFFLASLLSRRG
jgi:SAM-dependent methyltransferase